MIKRLSIFNIKLLPIIKFQFQQTKLNQQFLKSLKQEYQKKPSFEVFRPHIGSSSDYFKIFRLIETQPFSIQSYSQMREQSAKINPSSDNIRLLRSKINCRIAQNLYIQSKNTQNIQRIDKLYNQALQILQQSLVPQVMQYYGIYRRYGFFLNQINNRQKALQVLSQSVDILKQYVAQSDDPIQANYHSLQQAKACVKLIYLDPKQREKWLKLANQYWKQCESGVYDQIQYAQTVYQNSMDRKKIDQKKARLYAEVQMQKMKNQNHHKIVLKAFDEKQI